MKSSILAQSAWGAATWPEIAKAADGPPTAEGLGLVAILPTGAVEAHGPHLPLLTDGVIAEAMAQAAVDQLGARGVVARVLPSLTYAPAPFAAGFSGTISIRRSTQSALVCDVLAGASSAGVTAVAIANAHLDPEHIRAIHEGCAQFEERCTDSIMTVVFPDITRKPWALRLSDEFKSGACHAGQYESSIVMAAAPELVREAERVSLPPNPSSLAEAIRAGHTTFEESGMPDAFCGSPALASRSEGEATIKILGGIVVDALFESLNNQVSGED